MATSFDSADGANYATQGMLLHNAQGHDVFTAYGDTREDNNSGGRVPYLSRKSKKAHELRQARNVTIAGLASEDDTTDGTHFALHAAYHQEEKWQNQDEQHQRDVFQMASKAANPTEDLSVMQLETIRTRLIDADLETDIFSANSRERSDMYGLVMQFVGSALLIFSMNHAKYIDQNSNIITVATALISMLFVNSRLRHMIYHWDNEIAIVKRSLARCETNAELDAHAIANQEALEALQDEHSETAAAYVRMLRAETSEQLELRLVLAASRRRGVAGQAMVRLEIFAITFRVMTVLLGQGTLYVGYLLFRVIVDRVEVPFSDGSWAPDRIVLFAQIIILVVVLFILKEHRQQQQSGSSDD